MKTILISYDLQAPGKNYSELIRNLTNYEYWARVLESTWLVKTNYSTEEIKDQVSKHTDPNDRLFIVDVSGNYAAKNISSQVEQWIKQG
jgi:hypothetical protein